MRAPVDGVGDLRGGWSELDKGWVFLAASTFVLFEEAGISAAEEGRLSAVDDSGVVELTVAAGVRAGLCTGKVKAGRAVFSSCGSDDEHDGAGEGEGHVDDTNWAGEGARA